jgi:CHAD domain-containing protein
VKAREVPGLDPATPLRPNAALIVLARLDELRSLAPAALEPKAAEAQHDMRIAAKRLRYALEVLAPCFGPEAEAARDAAKRLQSVLGEVHDCDQMLPAVWGIESLRASLRERREARFAEFRDLWQEISPTLHTFSLLRGESGGDLTR